MFREFSKISKLAPSVETERCKTETLKITQKKANFHKKSKRGLLIGIIFIWVQDMTSKKSIA